MESRDTTEMYPGKVMYIIGEVTDTLYNYNF